MTVPYLFISPLLALQLAPKMVYRLAYGKGHRKVMSKEHEMVKLKGRKKVRRKELWWALPMVEVKGYQKDLCSAIATGWH